MNKTILVLFLSISFVLLVSSCNNSNMIPEEHTHTYSDEWSYDDVSHWHQSTCSGHQVLQKDYSQHSFDDSFECSVCHYKKRLTDIYTISSSGLLGVKNGSFFGSTITIPCEINGITVSSIAANSFNHLEKTKEIVLPISLTCIEDGAFSSCSSLQSVVIPESVTAIGSRVLSHCQSLQSITIPDSVETIGSDAFSYCDSLQFIDVDEENAFFSSLDGDLLSKDGSVLLIVPASRKGTYSIKTNVVSSTAFKGCNSIEKIIVSASTNNIPVRVFSDLLTLKEIEVDGQNPWFYSDNGCLFSSSDELLRVPVMKEGCLEVPDSTIRINSQSFSGCEQITDLVIPSSVVYIGAYAFSGCSGIDTIAISNPSIEFNNDQNGGSFSGFNGEVILPDTMTAIPQFAFYGTSASVSIPSSVECIRSYAFCNYSGFTEVEIHSGVTLIDTRAFYYNGITKITLPSSLSIIGWEAFYDCYRLKEIVFEGTISQWRLISKGTNAFGGRVPATTVKCSDGVTSLI